MNMVFVGVMLLLFLSGIGFGYFLAIWRMRQLSGGRTPAELQKELDDYRNEVSEHFAESAQLLGKMTEQYRDVYSHIARGAHKLGTGDELPPRVEQLRAKLITDGSTAEADESPDDEPPGAQSGKDDSSQAHENDSAETGTTPGSGPSRPSSAPGAD
ncbi:MAG: YhcB family protein [Pseudomonadales bacterium]|nr:YhcB family protein [Pseudomonadales bacterium]